jgi:hypothetical protein
MYQVAFQSFDAFLFNSCSCSTAALVWDFTAFTAAVVAAV